MNSNVQKWKPYIPPGKFALVGTSVFDVAKIVDIYESVEDAEKDSNRVVRDPRVVDRIEIISSCGAVQKKLYSRRLT